ncbi:sensor histidine kinase [Mycetocola spongiae]|uniref:sensor histidine kinase n=1 Tax=Mycetocola spongiae TaxID=2859226 RepID=UPI001CF1E753|nr:histidine kinase [Mycetocola spongiae]UCR90347.1 hypothetical protein KXZ72_06785 [Mycetocola spongiae]
MNDSAETPLGRVIRLGLHAVGIGSALSLELGAGAHDPLQRWALGAALALWALLALFSRGLPGGLAPWAWPAILAAAALACGLGSLGASVVLTVALALTISDLRLGGRQKILLLILATLLYGLGRLTEMATPDNTVSVLSCTAAGLVIGLLRWRSAGLGRAAATLARERAENAVLGERARLARDLHDVLAHTLGGLVMQLDALDALAEARPGDPEVRRRILAARTLALGGLEEARGAVDALRTPVGPLDDSLLSLAHSAAALGHEVRIEVRGEAEPAPAQADALYAVAVEALTNARKHSPGTASAILVTRGRDETALRITTLAHGGSSGLPSGGHGLEGMAERILLVGGTFSAGIEDGAWTVEARVPRESTERRTHERV